MKDKRKAQSAGAKSRNNSKVDKETTMKKSLHPEPERHGDLTEADEAAMAAALEAASTRSRAAATKQNDDALRWKVFNLVCENLTDEAMGVAGDALQDHLSMGLLNDELLRPVIEHDNGFWLDQLVQIVSTSKTRIGTGKTGTSC